MSDEPTLTLEQLFEQFGIVESAKGRKSNPLIRQAYTELANGAEYVYVYGKGTPSELLTLAASAPEVVEGNAVILHDDNTKAASLKRSLDWRNSAAANHGEETYGAVHTVGKSMPIDGKPTVIGVKVWSV